MQLTACPDPERLSAHLEQKLSRAESEAIAEHLRTCGACRFVVTSLECRRSDPQPSVTQQPTQRAEGDTAEGMGAEESPIPMELGEYRLLEKLGEGGMGAVYKAVHTRLDKIVALKLLRNTDQADDSAVTRFEREMKAVGRLNHPNLIQAYDAREIAGLRFLVTEYVEGLDLAELVCRGGPMPVADACEVGRQAALGLQAIHEHGMVHRDIKPSNLMLTKQGQVKLLDLGLARGRPATPTGGKLTTTGVIMGTADYMAPEQVSDCHTADIRADLYSLGCTLYELLTGDVPFGDAQFKTFFDKIAAHMMRAPRPIHKLRGEVPELLAATIHRMLAKEPAERFATPADVAEALTPFAAEADLPAWLRRCGVKVSLSSAPSRPLVSEVSHRSTSAGLAAQILAGVDDARPRKGAEADRSYASQVPTSSQRPGGRRLLQTVAVLVLGSIPVGLAVRQIGSNGDSQPKGRIVQTTPKTSATTGHEPVTVKPVESERPSPSSPATPEPSVPVDPPASVAKQADPEPVASSSSTTPLPSEPPPASGTSLPAAAPPLAVAPFDGEQAQRHQTAWAEYLGIPIEETNSIGMKLTLLPPGEFSMGSPEDDAQKPSVDANERPSHDVKISGPFYLAAHEVTQAEFQRVMGTNPSHRSPRAGDKGEADAAAQLPVDSVSWDRAAEFCRKLSALPTEQAAGRVYRLPTEAEWEYACRAGSVTRGSSGDDEKALADQGWFMPHSENRPRPVGQKKPNAWGLYDMVGNVFEWCTDWFSPTYYKESPLADPPGPVSGLERVIRGGSWWNSAAHCRSAARVGSPQDGSEMIGFRVVCEIPANVRGK